MAHWNNPPSICIIGAGLSGLCAAIQLQKQLNIDSYTVFDDNEDVGGTWLVNKYPGCACDVASHLYSYSFEPNPNWSKAYSGQHEIWEYIRDVANKYDLYHKIKFRHRVTEAKWNERIEKWEVTILEMNSGREIKEKFDLVIAGIGHLRVPKYPEQFDPFQGPKMHSAEWDSSIELRNKVVAVVGSGASAVQIIPSIVDKVKRLIVYQRRAAWVTSRWQMGFPGFLKSAFAYIPGLQWSLRNIIFWYREMTYFGFKANSYISKLAIMECQSQLNKQIEDPELRKKLTPDYQFGCKRVTPSNEYYPALAKPNVTVITSKIMNVTNDTIVNEDGTVEKPEVLILATGFKVQEFFQPLQIIGKGGLNILQTWKDDKPITYGGMCSNSMPNMFFLLGPNTGLGHSTVIFTIECQVNWLIQVLREMRDRNVRTATVTKEAEAKYMNSLNEDMKKTVWGTTKCGSWYSNSRGDITIIWPNSLVPRKHLASNFFIYIFSKFTLYLQGIF